jgi:hypothetical protein
MATLIVLLMCTRKQKILISFRAFLKGVGLASDPYVEHQHYSSKLRKAVSSDNAFFYRKWKLKADGNESGLFSSVSRKLQLPL